MSEQLELELVLPEGTVKEDTVVQHRIEIYTKDLEDINLKLIIAGLEEKQATLLGLNVLVEEDNGECQEYIILNFYDKEDVLVDKVGVPYFSELPEHLQEIIKKENKIQ